MEKLVVLFQRKSGTSRAEFYDYYVNVHNPLGMSLNPGLHGYTVNFVQSEGTAVDAVTEIWTPSARDLMTGKTFPTPEHRAQSIADGRKFLGPSDQLAVEETVVRGGDWEPSVGEGPCAKLVTLHRAGQDPGEPPAEAFRVVDNRVVEIFFTGHSVGVDDEDEAPGESDLALIRMCWAERFEALPAGGGPDALRVVERRERVLPGEGGDRA